MGSHHFSRQSVLLTLVRYAGTRDARTLNARMMSATADPLACPSLCGEALLNHTALRNVSRFFMRCDGCCTRCPINVRLLRAQLADSARFGSGAHAFAEHVAAAGLDTLIFFGDSVFTQIFTWTAYELHQSGASISYEPNSSSRAVETLSYFDLAMVTFASRYFRSLRAYYVELRSGRRLRVLMLKIGALDGRISTFLSAELTRNAMVLTMLPSAHYNLEVSRASFGDAFGFDAGIWLLWIARLSGPSTSPARTLVIESPAQHWPHGIIGHFDNTRGKMREVSSCAANVSDRIDLPENDAKNRLVHSALVKHADALQGVVWISFYNLTRDVPWAHAQCGGNNWDCTHFCYVPGLLEPLWRELLAGSKGRVSNST